MRHGRRATRVGLLAVLVVGGVVLWAVLLRPRLPAAERGRRLAEATGCFTCHGPGGIRPSPNPGRPYPRVPGFEGDLMMYAEGPDDVRAWIRDGVTPRRAQSRSWKDERDRGLLAMPAFGERLSESEIEDLVAFVLATAGEPAPGDSLARRGRDRAGALGCFGCHGPGGRFAPPNPGSLKGYIPSWDGADFPDLVRDRTEFEQWVTEGVSDRLHGNRAARFFLERAALRMPAYDRFLEPGDLDALWAYVGWLRRPEGE